MAPLPVLAKTVVFQGAGRRGHIPSELSVWMGIHHALFSQGSWLVTNPFKVMRPGRGWEGGGEEMRMFWCYFCSDRNS